MKNKIFIVISFFLFFNLCFAAVLNAEEVEFSREEILFMQNNPVIRLGVDPEFVPFEFIDEDGNYRGIAADFLALIAEKTGLRFEIIKGKTWTEAYALALEGELDVLPAVSKTEERETNFLFTRPYYFFKRVLVVREKEREISGIEDIRGLSIAVQKNSSHHSYLLDHQEYNLSLYETVTTALTAVANGNERVYLGNLATTNYLIKKNALTGLKMISFEAEKETGLHFAVRKDWPELVTILDKALVNISEREKNEIYNSWIDLKMEIDYSPIIKIIINVALAVVIIWLLSLYWIMRLRREIEIRKKTQKELEDARADAEEANNIKSSFLARMSHEIRTPLNAIIGMAYLLKKTDATLTQKMYVDRINQAGYNMLNIINDILDFSKIESGKVEIENISFSLDQVIQEVINIVSFKIEEQKIGFRLLKDPSLPNHYFGDSKRLGQILVNIINNAAKFTSQGEVSFEARLEAKEGSKAHLVFIVKDTGIGMTKEQVEGLFTPFSQADVSISRRFGGTGLGLSIVKNLLEMMEGTVQVFSTEGAGSTFIIRISLEVDEKREKEYRERIAEIYFGNIKTLVLEKSGSNMNLIDSYLGSFGMSCELTTSPESAITMLETAGGSFGKPFDLFILDYDCVEEGGFAFWDRIKFSNKLSILPKSIILLPMLREDLLDKLEEHGIDMGVGKPIIPSVLFNAIVEIFKVKALGMAKIPERQRTLNQAETSEQFAVLIVEDNKTNQLIASSLLQGQGMKLYFADNGREGIEVFKEKRENLDLILMDLHMPVVNGYDAAREIRELDRDIPIVAMTADVIQGVRERCEAVGIYHYLSKPFEPEKLLPTLLEIIRNNKKIEKEEKMKPEIFETKEIFNPEKGIKLLGNKKELYRRVLEQYLQENKDTAGRFSAEIKEKNYAQAVSIVHKLKGSSASIGADLLHKEAAVLQKRLEENSNLVTEEQLKSFVRILKALLAEIEAYLSEQGRQQTGKEEMNQEQQTGKQS